MGENKQGEAAGNKQRRLFSDRICRLFFKRWGEGWRKKKRIKGNCFFVLIQLHGCHMGPIQPGCGFSFVHLCYRFLLLSLGPFPNVGVHGGTGGTQVSTLSFT